MAPCEMKMEEKWIPSMPVPQWKQWNTRGGNYLDSKIGLRSSADGYA